MNCCRFFPRIRPHSRLLIFGMLLTLVFQAFVSARTSSAARSTRPSIVPALRTRAHQVPQMDNALNDLWRAAEHAPETLAAVADQHQLRLEDNRVQTIIEATDRTPQRLESLIAQVDGRVTSVITGAETLALFQAWIPVSNLDELANDPSVAAIRQPLLPMLNTVTSAGVLSMNADTWHENGYQGKGLTVAIIDAGFLGYPARIQEGELPNDINLVNFVDNEFPASQTNMDKLHAHGTAVGEIIYDLAPKASFYFIKIATEIDLIEAIDWLQTADHTIDVVSVSLDFANLNPGDGSDLGQYGLATRLTKLQRDRNILWVQSAGNNREVHYAGTYAKDPYDYTQSPGEQYFVTHPMHLFDSADLNSYANTLHGKAVNGTFAVSNTIEVSLRWDDWTTKLINFDLKLLWWDAAAGAYEEVAASEDVQDGQASDEPTESIYYTVPAGKAGQYFFIITWAEPFPGAPVPTSFLDLTVGRSSIGLGYSTPEHSLSDLATYPSVLSVAAVDIVNPSYPIMDYSGQGPIKAPGGGPPTTLGNKPDISSFANVATKSYPVFGGTSAAAPHAAGAALLVWDSHPGWSALGIKRLMVHPQFVNDYGAPGFDSRYGNGVVDLEEPYPLYQELFNTIVAGRRWIASGTNTATAGQWEQATPIETKYTIPADYIGQKGGCYTLSPCLVTGAAGGDPDDHDVDGGVTTRQSPLIILPSGENLELSFTYHANILSSDPNDRFEVRVKGQNSTVTVWQTTATSNMFPNEWKTITLNISSFAGQGIRLEVVAADEGADSFVEGSIDDVIIRQLP